MSESGWIGVDLDRTLAYYDGKQGLEHIGEPVPLMAQRVRYWLDQGVDVRIFTARATGGQRMIDEVQDWTEKHFGKRLPVTATKDFATIRIYDDIAVQVIPNSGLVVEGGEL